MNLASSAGVQTAIAATEPGRPVLAAAQRVGCRHPAPKRELQKHPGLYARDALETSMGRRGRQLPIVVDNDRGGRVCVPLASTALARP
jgi:hypothetical protein